jgi:PadR family transcriptional regulator
LIKNGWIRAKWGESDNNRRAKYYSLTPAGRKYLEQEEANWKRPSTTIGLVLEKAGTLANGDLRLAIETNYEF